MGRGGMLIWEVKGYGIWDLGFGVWEFGVPVLGMVFGGKKVSMVGKTVLRANGLCRKVSRDVEYENVRCRANATNVVSATCPSRLAGGALFQKLERAFRAIHG